MNQKVAVTLVWLVRNMQAFTHMSYKLVDEVGLSFLSVLLNPKFITKLI